MLKIIRPREPKICFDCKVDLFKQPGQPNGLICGLCGQQYEVKKDTTNE